ncbi:MAG: acyltransferase family protein [bacterium]
MEKSGSEQRIHSLDWLRVFAVVMLVPFHSAMIFVLGDFHIKNGELSLGLTIFNGFVHFWHMPLFFFVAGAGTWFALQRRTVAEYVKERFLRLFVPLVFGILLIIPPQVYYERILKSQFSGSYIAFYPHFFRGVYPRGNFSWHHLWFLAYLFVFSMLSLKIFLWLRSEKAKPFNEKAAAYFGAGARIFYLSAPLIIVEALLRIKYPGWQTLVSDWANFLFYLIVFIYGAWLNSEVKLQKAIVRNRWTSLACGAIISVIFLIIELTGHNPPWGYNAARIGLLSLNALNRWFWLLAIVGFGMNHLEFHDGFLRYANQAALPFYILHQTVIIVIGFYIIQLRLALMIKYAVICIAAFPVTIAVYDSLIKRVNVLRFIFGMRLNR